MSKKDKPEGKSLEDILTQMEKETAKSKINYSKFVPIGWNRLTDEQRKSLQELIYRYIENNKESK
jgi:hypothetical protein